MVFDLELLGVSKRFGETLALDRVDLKVPHGKTVALLGPSGCGKSTLLALVAGLETYEGTILWQGHDLADIKTESREFGMVFQDYALFPHLNVFENIAFGLRIRRIPLRQLRERVFEVLALVGLEHLQNRDVTTLSGGERQRVALARALASEPRLLMLDEPLAALDRNLRDRLAEELGIILRDLKISALYVTHDVEEALAVADLVAVMQPRHIARIGTPQEIYRKPGSEFVARFLGLDNLVSAQLDRVSDRLTLRTEIGTFPAEALSIPEGGDTNLMLLLRPHGIIIVEEESTIQTVSNVTQWVIQGSLTGNSFRGSAQLVQITVSGIELRFRVAPDQILPPLGSPLTFAIDPQNGACLIPPTLESD